MQWHAPASRSARRAAGPKPVSVDVNRVAWAGLKELSAQQSQSPPAVLRIGDPPRLTSYFDGLLDKVAPAWGPGAWTERQFFTRPYASSALHLMAG